METMTNELTVIPGTIGMMGGMGMLKPEFIEDAVIVSEEEQEEHPNFIESNTSGITLEELERNCIVPSFSDNQLTIATRHSYTGSRMLQGAILQVRTLEIPRSECPTKSWAECQVH